MCLALNFPSLRKREGGESVVPVGWALAHQIIYSSDHIQLLLKSPSLAKRGRGDLAEVKLALWIMSPSKGVLAHKILRVLII